MGSGCRVCGGEACGGGVRLMRGFVGGGFVEELAFVGRLCGVGKTAQKGWVPCQPPMTAAIQALMPAPGRDPWLHGPPQTGGCTWHQPNLAHTHLARTGPAPAVIQGFQHCRQKPHTLRLGWVLPACALLLPLLQGGRAVRGGTHPS